MSSHNKLYHKWLKITGGECCSYVDRMLPSHKYQNSSYVKKGGIWFKFKLVRSLGQLPA